MAEVNNFLLGILAVILGILVIAFPLFSVFTASVLAGLAIVFLGIWLLAQSFGTWGTSKATGIAFLILGLTAIVCGIGLFGHILLFSALASFWLYLAGFFLIISGAMSLIAEKGKGVGDLGVILGILYIIMGMYAWNHYYLALLIAIWLIADGISIMIVGPSKLKDKIPA